MRYPILATVVLLAAGCLKQDSVITAPVPATASLAPAPTDTVRVYSPFRGSQPLYVVDGVPIANAPSSADFLNLDIQTIEVIRGAAALARYGSRAESGVILIKTKKR
jgi:TonB-dependent SusC/RagA subfamily outer membrane receptor